jgi:methyl-accepting chemotaxis protein
MKQEPHAGSKDHQALLSLALFAAAAVLLSWLCSAWLAQDVTAPVAALKRAIEERTQTPEEAVVAVESDDEIGELAAAFNHMSRLLKDQVERVKEAMAAGREAADKLNEIMMRIVQVVAEQASASSEHAVTIQQISSTSEQMAATLRQIAENARSVDEVAGRTLSACHQGQQRLADVSAGVSAAMSRARQVAERMLFFQEQSNRIESILLLISDISNRINLIAFNAANEASSLGAAGDRFAIVASQMRDLAEKTMAGAKEIQTLFSDLSTATASAIIATEEGEKQIAAARDVGDRAAEDFQAIVHWAGETARAAQEIALSSKQQTSATDHLATALGDIREVAAKIADTAKVLETSVNELDNTSYQLGTALHRDHAPEERPKLQQRN